MTAEEIEERHKKAEERRQEILDEKISRARSSISGSLYPNKSSDHQQQTSTNDDPKGDTEKRVNIVPHVLSFITTRDYTDLTS